MFRERRACTTGRQVQLHAATMPQFIKIFAGTVIEKFVPYDKRSKQQILQQKEDAGLEERTSLSCVCFLLTLIRLKTAPRRPHHPASGVSVWKAEPAGSPEH